MEAPQPSTSRSAIESDLQPSASRSAVEDEPRLSKSHSAEDEPPAKRHQNVNEVRGMWNLVKLYRELGTRGQAVVFAEERGMIRHEKLCNRHRKPMNIEYSTNKTVGSFTCHKGLCKARSKISRGKGTWFANVKIQMPQVFYLMYAFTEKYSYDRTIKEDFTEQGQCLSRSTINNWFKYCRDAVVAYQIKKQTVTGKIGGPGKVVQIYESKFGKTKYEGHWILGMIEDRSEDLRLEICPDHAPSTEVLIPLIKKHIAEGTTIHSNFGQAYDCLEDHGYIHCKVNHSNPNNPFVGEDGTHVFKRFFYKDNYNNSANMTDLIYEYLWRRDVGRNKRDPFEELIKVINDGFN